MSSALRLGMNRSPPLEGDMEKDLEGEEWGEDIFFLCFFVNEVLRNTAFLEKRQKFKKKIQKFLSLVPINHATFIAIRHMLHLTKLDFRVAFGWLGSLVFLGFFCRVIVVVVVLGLVGLFVRSVDATRQSVDFALQLAPSDEAGPNGVNDEDPNKHCQHHKQCSLVLKQPPVFHLQNCSYFHFFYFSSLFFSFLPSFFFAWSTFVPNWPQRPFQPCVRHCARRACRDED